jgi:hypothetical protein
VLKIQSKSKYTQKLHTTKSRIRALAASEGMSVGFDVEEVRVVDDDEDIRARVERDEAVGFEEDDLLEEVWEEELFEEDFELEGTPISKSWSESSDTSNFCFFTPTEDFFGLTDTFLFEEKELFDESTFPVFWGGESFCILETPWTLDEVLRSKFLFPLITRPPLARRTTSTSGETERNFFLGFPDERGWRDRRLVMRGVSEGEDGETASLRFLGDPFFDFFTTFLGDFEDRDLVEDEGLVFGLGDFFEEDVFFLGFPTFGFTDDFFATETRGCVEVEADGFFFIDLDWVREETAGLFLEKGDFEEGDFLRTNSVESGFGAIREGKRWTASFGKHQFLNFELLV